MLDTPSNLFAFIAVCCNCFNSSVKLSSLFPLLVTPSARIKTFTMSPFWMCLTIVPAEPKISSSGWATTNAIFLVTQNHLLS